MKYVDEFRDARIAKGLSQAILKAADRTEPYRFMEFCGGHTHTMSRYGVVDLLPPNVEMIHGPGCPVCVLPAGRIDAAIRLALSAPITLCVYADLMRAPGARGDTLFKARTRGADVRMIYSTLDALKIAEERPEREIVFLAIGFETTTPPTALALIRAKALGLKNFSVFCNHVLTPAAMRAILEQEGDGVRLDGVVGPAHVSMVTGTRAFEDVAQTYRKPVVVSGFEPLDLMQSILMLTHAVNSGRSEVENQYTRAVSRDGNLKAQREMAEVFDVRESFEWRGLGEIPLSALRLSSAFADFDAERRFAISTTPAADNPACECGAVLRGVTKPNECKLFGTLCTPQTPMGACMVSAEGACAAHYAYGRFRDRAGERREMVAS